MRQRQCQRRESKTVGEGVGASTDRIIDCRPSARKSTAQLDADCRIATQASLEGRVRRRAGVAAPGFPPGTRVGALDRTGDGSDLDSGVSRKRARGLRLQARLIASIGTGSQQLGDRRFRALRSFVDEHLPAFLRQWLSAPRTQAVECAVGRGQRSRILRDDASGAASPSSPSAKETRDSSPSTTSAAKKRARARSDVDGLDDCQERLKMRSRRDVPCALQAGVVRVSGEFDRLAAAAAALVTGGLA